MMGKRKRKKKGFSLEIEIPKIRGPKLPDNKIFGGKGKNNRQSKKLDLQKEIDNEKNG